MIVDATAFPDVGSEQGPGGPGTKAIEISHEEWMRALNPLQHLPGVGIIYRLATGDTIPAPVRVLGAGILGGPMGMLGAGIMGLAEKLLTDGPDQSRPAAPAGFAATGSESGAEPVTPGSLGGSTAYTSLATIQPDWLGGTDPGRLLAGADAYRVAELVEKGLA